MRTYLLVASWVGVFLPIVRQWQGEPPLTGLWETLNTVLLLIAGTLLVLTIVAYLSPKHDIQTADSQAVAMQAKILILCGQCNHALESINIDTADMPEELQQKINKPILAHREKCTTSILQRGEFLKPTKY